MFHYPLYNQPGLEHGCTKRRHLLFIQRFQDHLLGIPGVPGAKYRAVKPGIDAAKEIQRITDVGDPDVSTHEQRKDKSWYLPAAGIHRF